MKVLLHRLGIALIGISLLIVQPAQAKQLKSADMVFLDGVFEAMPNLTACILMAQKHCNEVIHHQETILHKLKKDGVLTTQTKSPDSIDQLDRKSNALSKAEIDLLLDYALAPIKDFFCHIKDRKGLITNLMQESFADFDSNKKFEQLNIIEFLNSDSRDLLEYFGKKSERDHKVAIDFLLEIEHMFNDFKDSMSEKTLEEVRKHLIAVNKSHQEKISHKGS